MVTSRDVARRAGVSQSTVSAALSLTQKNIRMSAETRRRILAAAAELGYTPHPGAQALRRQRSDTIGFIPRVIRTTPYEQPVPYHLGMYLARAATARGYSLMEATPETVGRGTEELTRFMLGRRVDAIISDSPGDPAEVATFVEAGIPVVQIIRPQFVIPTPSITIDAGPGIDAAIDYFLAMGHRQIALIGSNGTHPVDRARVDCFAAALTRAGVAIPDHYLCLEESYSIEDGHRAAEQLLALPQPPSAIFAAGDNLALGALQALYEARVAVPAGMSMISYDDVYACYLYPPLTSVAQPLAEAAERAVAIIAHRLGEEDVLASTNEQIVIPTTLTIRRSVGPPPILSRVATT